MKLVPKFIVKWLRSISLPKISISMSKSTSTKVEDWNYSYHAVAFVDILGQKDAFINVKGVPADPVGYKNLIAALKDTVTFVEKFREGFSDCFNSYTKPTGGEAQVAPEFREEYLKLKKSNINLYGLSDSVVAWTSLRAGDSHCAAMNSIYGILMASSGMFILSLATKHAIRGGIEIDGGIRLAEKSVEIYGPALFKAYHLESCVAKHPRIVIGPGMRDFLRAVSVGTATERSAIYARQLAGLCSEMIVKDSDGEYVLDYLGQHVLKTASRALPQDKVLIPAKNFVANEIARWEAAKNWDLAERYRKDLKYFDSKLPDL